MKAFLSARWLVGGFARIVAAMLALGVTFAAGSASAASATSAPSKIQTLRATVNGVTLQYLRAGSGPGTPIVLLHGYAETSHMWRPLMAKLAANHVVIAPDLRGAGGSEKPEGGYGKKALAGDIHALVQQLGLGRVKVVGHDIGLMVAYAYAAEYTSEVESVVLMDAFLPGVGNWQHVWLLRDLWHFHFHGTTPLALVAGRERTYFEHFWNDFAADPKHSLPEADRRFYARAYAQPGGMRAGFEYFKAFEQDAAEFAVLSKTKLKMPMLVLTGEKASGAFLIEQAKLVATDVEGVIVEGSGHWLMEERPEPVMARLVSFLDRDPKKLSAAPAEADRARVRLTSSEIDAQGKSGPGAGTSGVAGIQTSTLKGDPTKPGLYTIVLRVPPNTRIAAHQHPDDRMATVISGTWYFGYGERYAEEQLKALPPGSFYTEPPGLMHFARTRETPVVVQISGYGPSGTVYAAPVASAR